jgi:hypothetical protein
MMLVCVSRDALQCLHERGLALDDQKKLFLDPVESAFDFGALCHQFAFPVGACMAIAAQTLPARAVDAAAREPRRIIADWPMTDLHSHVL